MVMSMGMLSVLLTKLSMREFLSTISTSADVKLVSISEGKDVMIKWCGKPQEVNEAHQSDKTCIKKPEWLIMLGICTHLRCVPIEESGNFRGWFCPCHGSHYDISGHIQMGPAPPYSIAVMPNHCHLTTG
ncbi:Rieske [2Fe-2S] iron-sulfur domain-containing protein [Lactarius quietus]|nr:Rieske [2Fe-2S] iron-sulfur domain-containing protein [Lactarius quietus]